MNLVLVVIFFHFLNLFLVEFLFTKSLAILDTLANFLVLFVIPSYLEHYTEYDLHNLKANPLDLSILS